MSFLSGFNISKPKDSFIEMENIVNFDFGIHKMKPNQKLVYNYINERFFILSEPPGAGKSTSIKFVVNELLRKNPKLKVIIAVPQTLISKSFGSIMLEYPNGDKVEWDISNNLCDKIGILDKIGELNNFINKDEFGNNPADRITMVTHITLSKLNTEGENFNDVMFIIDEGHHVLYPENGGTESANKIGALVHYMMNQKKSNVKIWFATATFYRGDKSNIIPPEEMEKFTTYHLPLDEYWRKYIKHIQSFSYDFVMYKNRDVFSEIKEIFKQKGKRKTIIFCPYIGYLVNDINKLQFRDKVIEAIKEVWEDCKFLDLIEIEDRYDKKQIVINDSEDFDVVLSVKLFDEGTDWIQAESIIDLCPSNSLRIQVQRFGRLLRDIVGKTHIDYNVFLPYESKFKDDEERRLHMSRSFNAFTASCLLHEAIEPVMKPVVKNNVKSKINLGINDSKKQELIGKVIKDLMFLKNIVNIPSLSESKECIINSIKEFGIKNNIEEGVEFVVKTLRRSSIPKTTEWESQTIDISWMIEKGFDKIWDNSLYDSILSFSTGVCGVGTFNEFRSVYDGRKTKLEWQKFAEEIFTKTGEFKPYSKYMIKKYPGFSVCVTRFPEYFEHLIPMKPDEKWRTFVDKLADDNSGILPSCGYIKRKHPTLSTYMYAHPDVFKGVWQYYGTGVYRVIKVLGTNIEHDAPQLEKHFTIINNLLKENNILPNNQALNKIDYGLSDMLLDHPEFFHGIKQFYGRGYDIVIQTINTNKKEKGYKYHPNFIKVKKLAEENNGIIPSHKYLKSIGEENLGKEIWRRSDIFSGMKMHKYSKIVTIGKK